MIFSLPLGRQFRRKMKSQCTLCVLSYSVLSVLIGGLHCISQRQVTSVQADELKVLWLASANDRQSIQARAKTDQFTLLQLSLQPAAVD